jgi:hypothetical protein
MQMKYATGDVFNVKRKWVSERTRIAERLSLEQVMGAWPSTLAKEYQDPY